uniref:Uncharacterized protein n=1 Tax=Rhizophora mucronata TaxID=61149 RepID=A0A2P2QDR7_RHIMU
MSMHLVTPFLPLIFFLFHSFGFKRLNFSYNVCPVPETLRIVFLNSWFRPQFPLLGNSSNQFIENAFFSFNFNSLWLRPDVFQS